MVATAEILGYFTALCAQRAMNFNEARRIWLSIPDFVAQLWRKKIEIRNREPGLQPHDPLQERICMYVGEGPVTAH